MMDPRDRWTFLSFGWYRRSAYFLDLAGCPAWLINRRCSSNPPDAYDLRIIMALLAGQPLPDLPEVE